MRLPANSSTLLSLAVLLLAMSSSTTTTLAQRDSSAVPTPTRPAPVTTTNAPTSVAPSPTSHSPPPPPPTSAPPPVITVPSSAPPVVIPTPSAVPSAAPTSTLNAPCMSSSQCGANQLCAYQTQGAITGYCQAMVSSLCRSDPAIPCQSSAQCNDPAYSYCVAPDEQNPLNKICTGLGMPGTSTQCGANGNVGGSNGGSGNNNSLTNTLKYAGIAVGSVALLGIIFALVRWQRNKRRSTIPDFAEIDYGMSNRHRSSVGGGAAAAVGGSGGAEQSYPFSNRPNAATAGAGAAAVGTHDQDGFYDDQYYDDQYAQNMHPMAGMAAGGLNKQQASPDQYYDQYAQNNHYDPQQQAYDEQYYKEAAAYGGYDQHGNYVGDGTYYDNNAAYGDYGAQQQQQYGAAQVVPSTGAEYAVTSPTSPLDAHLRANAGAVNQYGVEPSELDFGGTTQAPGAARQHGGGYGQRF